MTWLPDPNAAVAVNATVLLILLLGVLVGVCGGFHAALRWALERLGRSVNPVRSKAQYDTPSEVAFLREWAADNKAVFEDEGECGFGRECVGIQKDGCYPYYRQYVSLRQDPYMRENHACPEAEPPSEVAHAYHKVDCLAVLGRGPEAIHELYVWVKNLKANGVEIQVRPREFEGAPTYIDVALGGSTEPILVATHKGKQG